MVGMVEVDLGFILASGWARSKLGFASPLSVVPHRDQTFSGRALPSRPERFIVQVKLLEGSTSLGVMPKHSGEPQLVLYQPLFNRIGPRPILELLIKVVACSS